MWPDGKLPNMILDDGGDATLLVHKGVEFEKAGAIQPLKTVTMKNTKRFLMSCGAQLSPAKVSGVILQRVLRA